MVEEFGGELLKVLVVLLKGGEVQGGKGLLVDGVFGCHYQSHCPLLHLPKLTELSGVEG